MNSLEAPRPDGDSTVRDLLSSLTALQTLSLVMVDSDDDTQILRVAVSAVPSLSRRCTVAGIWLDGAWRAIDAARLHVGSHPDLEPEILALGDGGGPLVSQELGWAWAFPLSSRGGASGHLIVRAPAAPPAHEHALIHSLALQSGVALANARLLARERATLARIADEQATLRRVAALVARAASPEAVFEAVAAEAGRLRDAEVAVMSRYNTDGTSTVVGAWASDDDRGLTPVGTRVLDDDRCVHGLVLKYRRPARTDERHQVCGAFAVRRGKVRSTVGVPIRIGGELWGVIGLASTTEDPLPSDSEALLGAFTELVATAIANAHARIELRAIAEDQAALRRVATRVAHGAQPEEVFAFVCEEAGRLLDAEFTTMNRYDAGNQLTVVGSWGRTGVAVPVGARLNLGGRNISTLVMTTGRAARLDSYGEDAGEPPAAALALGARSAVGAAIVVDGRLWGVVIVASSADDPLPPDTEVRLSGFTELVATAIANAENQAALSASRARIVTAADEARRRIERNLHDGVQQHLVSLALAVRTAESMLADGEQELEACLGSIGARLADVVDEVREIGQGLHPTVLARGGLRPALVALASGCAIPTVVDVSVSTRLPASIEVAAYYAVSEGLTNASKHSGATQIEVFGGVDDEMLRIRVADNGRGGAQLGRGTGLIGLKDRVEAIGGTVMVSSAPSDGTTLEIELPLRGPGRD